MMASWGLVRLITEREYTPAQELENFLQSEVRGRIRYFAVVRPVRISSRNISHSQAYSHSLSSTLQGGSVQPRQAGLSSQNYSGYCHDNDLLCYVTHVDVMEGTNKLNCITYIQITKTKMGEGEIITF